jgi:hypothetical protein
MSGARRSWIVVPAAAGAIVVVAVLLLADRDADEGPGCRMLLIPAYIPADAVLELARTVRPGLIVINPASGPGAEPDEAYKQAVRAAQRAGGRVLGYVPTGYGTRDPREVTADIDRYASWYGTDGVFLDEAAATAAQLSYYRALAGHVRTTGERLVVLNPGQLPERAYFDVADVIVTFEGSYADYAASRDGAPDWVGDLGPDRLAVLVYGASRDQAADVIGGARHAGYVYATSGTLPHPWGTVPTYLREENGRLDGCEAATSTTNASLEVAP